jgi:hypothetical protein
MSDLTLGIDFEWEEAAGDGTPCKKCKDPIFYKMHTMVVLSGPERAKTNNTLCDSCYNALDNE